MLIIDPSVGKNFGQPPKPAGNLTPIDTTDPATQQTSITDQIREALKQQAEMETCQRSFIITGLDEFKIDVDLVLEIVQALDNISLLPCDVESFTHIGRQSKANNKPRPVHVTLVTERRQLRSDIQILPRSFASQLTLR